VQSKILINTDRNGYSESHRKRLEVRGGIEVRLYQLARSEHDQKD